MMKKLFCAAVFLAALAELSFAGGLVILSEYVRPLETSVSGIGSDVAALTQSVASVEGRVEEVNVALGGRVGAIEADYVTSAGAGAVARESVIDMASDGFSIDGVHYKLVIQSFVPPPTETTFTLVGGAQETFDISGALDQTWMVDNGYYDSDQGEWLKSVTGVTVGTDVTKVGGYAFRWCDDLIEITMPNSVTNIGAYTFEGCSNLTSALIPGSVTAIESYAFKGCEGLRDVTIPDSVTNIGGSAFSSCKGITNLVIGGGVTKIGAEAFYNCRKLKSVVIPDSVTSLGYSAFVLCQMMTNVVIGNGVTNIGTTAFSACQALTDVIIPEGVMTIGRDAFSGCAGLTNITFEGRYTSELSGLADYSWGVTDTSILRGSLDSQ